MRPMTAATCVTRTEGVETSHVFDTARALTRCEMTSYTAAALRRASSICAS